jgi:acyl-CoA synthetase (AMP-forming)/AMP-acid ligase II
MMEKFDFEKALQLVESYRITYMYIPPPIVLAFGKHPLVDKYDLTSLKALHSGAAPLTKELTEAVWQKLKIPVKQGYGLSETSPVVSTQAIEEWARFMGSVGKLMPNMEAKIVDEDGKEVADGEAGELWVKGPNVFKGYLDNPEKTREAFSPCGCFKTGDIFTRDKYGNYYCVDRLKELIKYSKSYTLHVIRAYARAAANPLHSQMVSQFHQPNSKVFFWVTKTWLMSASLVSWTRNGAPRFHARISSWRAASYRVRLRSPS